MAISKNIDITAKADDKFKHVIIEQPDNENIDDDNINNSTVYEREFSFDDKCIKIWFRIMEVNILSNSLFCIYENINQNNKYDITPQFKIVIYVFVSALLILCFINLWYVSNMHKLCRDDDNNIVYNTNQLRIIRINIFLNALFHVFVFQLLFYTYNYIKYVYNFKFKHPGFDIISYAIILCSYSFAIMLMYEWRVSRKAPLANFIISAMTICLTMLLITVETQNK